MGRAVSYLPVIVMLTMLTRPSQAEKIPKFSGRYNLAIMKELRIGIIWAINVPVAT